MEFELRPEFSIDINGYFYLISKDEFVHRSLTNPLLITWMKGKQRAWAEVEYTNVIGVVDKALYFVNNRLISKAELINGEIIITDCVQIDEGIQLHFKFNCLYYFIERDEPNVTYAIPINEDYRSTKGIRFNLSIDEVEMFLLIHVHKALLFAITSFGNIISIRRYQSGTEYVIEKTFLPRVRSRSIVTNNSIFYLTLDNGLVSINPFNLAWEVTETNLTENSNIIGIDENGKIHVHTFFTGNTSQLLSAQLADKFMSEFRQSQKKEESVNVIETAKKEIMEKMEKEKEEKRGNEETENDGKMEKELENEMDRTKE